MHQFKKLVLFSIAALLSAGILAACNGDDDAAVEPNGAEETEEVSDAQDEETEEVSDLQGRAQEMVAEIQQPIEEFPFPDEPFDPGNFSAESMACGFDAPVCAEQAGFALEALEALGWDVPAQPFDGEFSPATQGGFLDRAVQRGTDAVIMVSVDLDTIPEAVNRALENDLVVGCVFCVASDEWLERGVIDVRPDFFEQGEFNAWAALAEDGEDTDLVAFTDLAFKPPPLRVDGVESVMSAECPECPFEVREFATESIAEPGPPEFTALLSARPAGEGLNNVVAHYDGLGMAMARTLETQGREDIKIRAYDVTPDSYEGVQDDALNYASSAMGPYTYSQWAAADLVARAVNGLPLWDGYLEMPNVLLTAENAADYADPPHDPVPEGDWQAEWIEMWQGE